MPVTSAERMKKYRRNHPEKVIEIRMKFYNENRDKESVRQKKKYLWKKESERLRHILLWNLFFHLAINILLLYGYLGKSNSVKKQYKEIISIYNIQTEIENVNHIKTIIFERVENRTFKASQLWQFQGGICWKVGLENIESYLWIPIHGIKTWNLSKFEKSNRQHNS